MKHKVWCYQCKKFVDLDMPGDLGQFKGDVINCPCGEEDLVVKPIPLYGLFHVADLKPPHNVVNEIKNE